MKVLFPQVNGLLHGGDYNPEQWLDRPDILQEDIRLMKQAGINTATLGVFSWAMYEKTEGVYEFEWLEKIINDLYQAGIYTVLATPSGARPAWLDEKYPEAMRVANNHVRNSHGLRHNHCMSSPKYREKVAQMDRKLAEQFGQNPAVILWHISNEFGGECFCDLCQKRFVNWLKDKYHNDIEELNHEWWTTFWSHNFNSFEQIEPPFINGEGCVHGLKLDWKRFTTWNMTDFMKSEIMVLRELSPHIPVTTNFMRLYNGLDYEVMAKELDVIAWDSYPAWNNDEEAFHKTMADAGFDHALMRSFLPGKPFMLMESTPSLVNWHAFNKIKRPGVHRITSLQAIACGSDTVQYFQWRKGRGSFEQYHGAVIDHLGTSDTRVFKEVEEMGDILKKLTPITGSVIKADTALLFDWNNRWAIQDMPGLSAQKKYEETCREQYRIFSRNGVEMDVILPSTDFSKYRMIVAPMLYLLKPDLAMNLKDYVAAGGILVATYLTGYVNENTLCYLGGFPGDGLVELFGLYSEEIDTLYPKDVNQVNFVANNEMNGLTGSYQIKDFCEVLKVKDAQVLGTYAKDYYADEPVITRKQFGKGCAYYVGARVEDAGMEALYRTIWTIADIKQVVMPEGVEYHRRAGDNKEFDFYLNETQEPVQVMLVDEGTDLIKQSKVSGAVMLKPLETMVVHVGHHVENV